MVEHAAGHHARLSFLLCVCLLSSLEPSPHGCATLCKLEDWCVLTVNTTSTVNSQHYLNSQHCSRQANAGLAVGGHAGPHACTPTACMRRSAVPPGQSFMSGSSEYTLPEVRFMGCSPPPLGAGHGRAAPCSRRSNCRAGSACEPRMEGNGLVSGSKLCRQLHPAHRPEARSWPRVLRGKAQASQSSVFSSARRARQPAPCFFWRFLAKAGSSPARGSPPAQSQPAKACQWLPMSERSSRHRG